jgi:hypothetical protein
MVIHVSRWSIPPDILSTLSLRLLFVPGPIETLIISMVSFPRQNIFIAGRSGFLGRLCFGYVMTMGDDVILPLISRISGQNLKYLILIVRSVDFFSLLTRLHQCRMRDAIFFQGAPLVVHSHSVRSSWCPASRSQGPCQSKTRVLYLLWKVSNVVSSLLSKTSDTLGSRIRLTNF